MYCDKTLFFEELVRIRDGFISIKIQNLQATEMFKIHMNEAPPIFSSRFESHNTKYNLGYVPNFSSPYVKIIFIWTGNLSFLGLKIRALVSTELKQLTNIKDFKITINKW